MELKPCPACGSDRVSIGSNYGSDAAWVACESCGMRGPDDDFDGAEWNAMPRREGVAFDQITAAIAAEIQRSEAIHGPFPMSVIHCAAIVAGESGELAQAAIYHVYSKPCPERIIKQAVQTAAMCYRFLLKLQEEGGD